MRGIADFSHLLSIFILLHKMKSSSVCRLFRVRDESPNRIAELLGIVIQVAGAVPLGLCDALSR